MQKNSIHTTAMSTLVGRMPKSTRSSHQPVGYLQIPTTRMQKKTAPPPPWNLSRVGGVYSLKTIDQLFIFVDGGGEGVKKLVIFGGRHKWMTPKLLHTKFVGCNLKPLQICNPSLVIFHSFQKDLIISLKSEVFEGIGVFRVPPHEFFFAWFLIPHSDF